MQRHNKNARVHAKGISTSAAVLQRPTGTPDETQGRCDKPQADLDLSFLESLPGSAAFLDRSGRILAVNERWHAFGHDNGAHDTGAWVGANYLAICGRARGDGQIEAREAASGIGAVLAGVQDNFMLEYSCHAPQQERWFLMTACRTGYADGFGAIILHIDISARKANQRAEQFLDEYFSTPFQEAAIGLAVINPSGQYVQTNDAFCKMLGYTEAELKLKDMISVTHPEDKAHNLLLLGQLFNGERQTFVIEKRYITKGGDTIWVRNSVSARRDALGQVTSVLAFSEDITARKAAFRQLEEAKGRLEIAGRLSRLGAWEIETQRKKVRLSEQAKLIYDLDPAHDPELDEILSLYVASDRKKLRAAIDACAHSGTPYDLELEIVTARKRRAWVRTLGEPAWEGDSIPLIQGAIQDVTERVMLQRKVSHAHKMEAVGQLTGGIAHDFNNLLTIILGNAELLEEQLPKDGDLLTFAQSTRLAAERGAKLIEHLLAFSRRQSLKPKAIDVARLIIDMSTLLGRTLGPTIGITLSMQSKIGQILADEAQLESAILNLGLNARDAMPKGGTINIDVRGHDIRSKDCELASLALGHYVCISITDTGSGMSADVIERACEPFFTTKQAGKGSGLGLSMVSGFVQQSKGEIKIESEPGVGTTVRIYLPRVDDKPAGVEVAQESARGRERILLVDDEADIRNYGKRQLEDFGYTVTVCENADEGWDLLRNGAQFDLLLSDVVMPGRIDGIGLAQRARELSPTLKVLLSTGYSEQIVKEIVDHGFLVLRKPYRKHDLAAKIREALAAEPASSLRGGRRSAASCDPLSDRVAHRLASRDVAPAR